ncbi:MAG: TonB-dependent receptor plug domain-containing protein [bacterium]
MKKLIMMLLIFFLSGLYAGAQENEKPDKLYLDEIVMTGTKTQHTLKDTPVTTHVIKEDEIQKSNAQTAGEALRWVPGVYIKSNGFARESVNIEGLPDKYTLVLIDGQRQTGRHANAVDLSNIAAEMIERIEVIKGPSSVLYGSEAIAGVVNIITKKGAKKGYFHGSSSYGTGNTVDTQMNFGDRYGKFSYTFAAGDHKSDQMGSGYEYDGKNVMGNFQYDLNQNTQCSLNLNLYDEESDYLEDSKFNGMVGFDFHFEENTNLTLQFTDHIAERKDIRPNQSPRDWDYDNYKGEVQYSRMIGKSNLITLGGEYRQNNLESTEVGKKDEEIISGFFQDEIEPSQMVSIVLAGRVDNHDQWGTQFNPKGSLLFRVVKNTNLRLNAGKAFLAPNLDQLYKITPHHHVQYWIIGNPDLEPEKSLGYSVDIEHNLANTLLSRLSFFRNDIKNMISSKEVGTYDTGEPIMQSYNINEAYSQGFEVELQAVPKKGLFTALSYTYTQSEDKDVKKQLRNMPEHTGRFRIQYDNKDYNFSLHYDMEYIGKMFTNSALTQKSDDFYLANVKITKDISKTIQLFFSIDNIFDEEPESSRYFAMATLYSGGFRIRY